MRIFKRVLAVTAIVLCVLFLLVSLAGIVGAWVIRERVNTAVVGLFSLADRTVSRVSDRVEQVIDTASQAEDALDNITSAVEKIGAGVEETPVVLRLLDGLLGEKLIPAMLQLDQRSRQFYQELGQLESALTAVNSMRLFRDPDGFLDKLTTRVSDFRDGMQQLDSTLRELQTALQEKRTAVAQELVVALTGPVERMQVRLADFKGRLNDLNSGLKGIQVALAVAQDRLLRLITVTTVILTLILIWLAISQVLAGLYALQYFRSLKVPPEPALAAGGEAPAEGETPTEGETLTGGDIPAGGEAPAES